MSNKNKKYPRGFSDQELEGLVDKYGDLPVDKAVWGPSYFSKATLGLIELRERKNTRIAKGTLFVAALALVVSLVSAYFSRIQARPIIEEYTKEQVENISKCLNDLDGNLIKNDGKTVTCKSFLKDRGYLFKSDLILPDLFKPLFDFSSTKIINDIE